MKITNKAIILHIDILLAILI